MNPTTETAPRVTVRCPFCQTWNRINSARIADRPKCGHCAKPMLFDRPLPLGDDDFARTIAESELPVLVDFYADWCGPCKRMAPDSDEIARVNQGTALVAKLNTDRAQRTSEQFGIRGIPTTIAFKGGKEVNRVTGAVPKKTLESLLASAM